MGDELQGDNSGYINSGGGGYSGGGGISPDIPLAPIDIGPLNPPQLESFPTAPSAGSDIWAQAYTDYISQGFSPSDAAYFADAHLEAVGTSGGTIQFSQSATELNKPLNLPTTNIPGFIYSPLPSQLNYPFYIPTFSEGPTPAPPPQPYTPSPASAQHLPPYCPQGQYHPYPIGDPRQDACVPFPSAPGPGPPQQSRPSQQPSPPPSSRPSAQQPQQLPKCPTGSHRDPWTLQCAPDAPPQQPCPPGYQREFFSGQCQPINRCTTPGTVLDPRSGRCIPPYQVSPGIQPEAPGQGTGSFLDDLANLPWWLWAGLAGLLLLGGGREERKRVTIQHRRAT